MTLSVFDFEPYRFFQRLPKASGSNHAWTYPEVWGSYDGQTAVKVAAANSAGTIQTGWSNATLYPDDGLWKASIPLTGAWLKMAARYGDDDNTKVIQDNLFGCGSIILLAGQSQCNYMAFHNETDPYTANFFPTWIGGDSTVSPKKQWQGNADWGTAKISEAIYNAKSGLVTATVNAGDGGSSCDDWLGGPAWDLFKDNLARIGGKIECIVWMHGEHPAYAGVSKAAYKSFLDTLLVNFRALLNRPALPFIIVGMGNSTGATSQNIQNIKDAQTEWYNANSTNGVLWGGSLAGLPTVDGMHITPDSSGAGVIGASIGNAIAAIL